MKIHMDELSFFSQSEFLYYFLLFFSNHRSKVTHLRQVNGQNRFRKPVAGHHRHRTQDQFLSSLTFNEHLVNYQNRYDLY